MAAGPAGPLGGRRAAPGHLPWPPGRPPRRMPVPRAPRGRAGPASCACHSSAGEGKRRAGGGRSSASGAVGPPGRSQPPFPGAAARSRRDVPAEVPGGAAVLPSGGRPRHRRAWALASRGRRPCRPARWSGCRRTSAGLPATRRRSGSMAVRTFPDPRPQPTSPGAGGLAAACEGAGRPRRAPPRQAGARPAPARRAGAAPAAV